jgi:hypothetical protein
MWLCAQGGRKARSPGRVASIQTVVTSRRLVKPMHKHLVTTCVSQPGLFKSAFTTLNAIEDQANDVRVFDVQRIKVLEFEAVFFVGVDELAVHPPTQVDKHLYVGATRATYLGLTCAGSNMPGIIEHLADQFGNRWQA